MKINKIIPRKLEYKWVIAAMCFLMIFTGLGFCSSAKSLYIAPITSALGFSRSAFSINDSCRYITTAIANIFFGTMVSKYGTKRLIGAGMICLIISSLLYSFATTLSLFYLGGIFLGLGFAWTTTTMVGVVINRWFKQNKGTVMGAVLAANGLGAALSIHITTPIIYQEGNPFGYQDSYHLVALILVVTTVVIMMFYKENPPVDNVLEEDIVETNKKTEGWKGFEYKTLLKKPYFYGIILCVFLRMMAGLGGITTPFFTDVGLEPEFVASSFSMLVLLLAICKFFIGFIYDRLGVKVATNICLVTGTLSTLVLFFVTNSLMGKVLCISYSVLGAIATPLETVMLPIIALDVFGENNYNKTLGILASVTTIGQALGTPIMNLAFDILKSYNVSFAISLVVSLVILIVMNLSMCYSAREKRALNIK